MDKYKWQKNRGYRVFGKSVLGILSAAILSCYSLHVAAADKPNIIIIMADDMGFSDLGCYGGEVETPNIDQLAQEGVRFTRFKNSARCAPSRASLLTGRYQHSVGVGRMTTDENRPGYRGQLSLDAPTLAEILKPHGYATGIVGNLFSNHPAGRAFRSASGKSCPGWLYVENVLWGYERIVGELKKIGCRLGNRVVRRRFSVHRTRGVWEQDSIETLLGDRYDRSRL